MLSDEEKKAINDLTFIIVTDIYDNEVRIDKTKIINEYNKSVGIVLNLIENLIFKTETQKELLKYKTDKIEKQSKEIEELKEDRKKYAEEYIHNNPWLYKQLNENYILRVESEQRERKAYIKGTNDADELCNKKWEDKIKAKTEEYEKALNILLQKDKWIEPSDTIIRNKFMHYIEFGQSLLEKEQKK